MRLKETATTPGRFDRLIAEGQAPAKAKGQVVGDILGSLLMPAADGMAVGADRAAQLSTTPWLPSRWRPIGSITVVTPTASTPSPTHLKAVPRDLFTGNALIYRPAANGYLLYSVGPNGKDDGGRGPEDQPQGDDIVVRMPPAR